MQECCFLLKRMHAQPWLKYNLNCMDLEEPIFKNKQLCLFMFNCTYKLLWDIKLFFLITWPEQNLKICFLHIQYTSKKIAVGFTEIFQINKWKYLVPCRVDLFLKHEVLKFIYFIIFIFYLWQSPSPSVHLCLFEQHW